MKPQLFLIHFAGGNRYSFNFMTSLSDYFEIIPLELPGRGQRMNEALITNFELASLDIHNQIRQKLTSENYLIYGHSMGAYLTLRVSSMLEKINLRPRCIVVSGNPGPGICGRRNRHTLVQEEFINELKELGGISNVVLENEELMNFFIPILRADFEISEKNSLENEPPVNFPLYAMMGNEEKNFNKIVNWAKFTKSYFQFEIMQGAHFFIYNHHQLMATKIKGFYDKSILKE